MNIEQLEIRTPKNAKLIAKTGDIYGSYTVIDDNMYYHKTNRSYHFHVKCKCGKENYIPSYLLKSNKGNECISCNKKKQIEESIRTNTGIVKRWKYRTYKDLSAVMFFHIRQKCKERNLYWDLSITPEYLFDIFEKQNKKCILSGLDITLSTKRKGVKPDFSVITASLDRIDSTIGYIKGNLQWVHKDINIMKNNHKEEYFKYLCQQVTNYANIEPSLTSTCKEGAETTGADTNLSDNTSKSVQQPENDICPSCKPGSLKRIKYVIEEVEDIVRS